jgi:L,D-peptidoglycan transpeptidase YkuD (ErfK/YbiS/YcfS/YnhG family)
MQRRVNEAGLTEMVGVGGATVRETAMVCGLLATPVAVMVMVAGYVPTARPEVK